MKALHLTEYEYGDMVLQYGNLWMQRYFGTQEAIIQALNSSKSFWKWWVNQWNNRDDQFIHEYSCLLNIGTKDFTMDLYTMHHDVHSLKIIPNIIVVREVGRLIKIEEKKLKELLK